MSTLMPIGITIGVLMYPPAPQVAAGALTPSDL